MARNISPSTTGSAVAENSGRPERRQAQRYHHRFAATLHAGADRPGVQVSVSDVSWTGCYVEMSSVLAVGFEVLLKFELSGIRLAERGIVCTSHPMMGMGIAFIEPSPDLRTAVSLLGDHSRETMPEPAQAQKQNPALRSAVPLTLMLTSVQEQKLARAALQWFETHDNLSRDEFAATLQQILLSDIQL